MTDERGARNRGPRRDDTWRPHPGLDIYTPNVARMYDYYLGGKDNFEADREAAEEAVAAVPEIRPAAQANRAFLRRAVRFLAAEAGIRQFVDIGTGLPTQDNTHHVALQTAPDARVAYVDNDPVVLTHARALLATDDRTVVVQGDMRQPAEILADPKLRELIDLDQPVAVLFISVLQFLADADDPQGVVAYLRDAVASRSHLVISHPAGDGLPQGRLTKVTHVYSKATSALALRSREQIHSLFDGYELVDPGLVAMQDWRPDAAPAAEAHPGAWYYVGVGRKP